MGSWAMRDGPSNSPGDRGGRAARSWDGRVRGRIPLPMVDGSRRRFPIPALALALALVAPGCASMRRNAPSPDLRPCAEGFATTRDGWMLGVRRIRPDCPDPAKLPVVLCHGLGLN